MEVNPKQYLECPLSLLSADIFHVDSNIPIVIPIFFWTYIFFYHKSNSKTELRQTFALLHELLSLTSTIWLNKCNTKIMDCNSLSGHYNTEVGFNNVTPFQQISQFKLIFSMEIYGLQPWIYTYIMCFIYLFGAIRILGFHLQSTFLWILYLYYINKTNVSIMGPLFQMQLCCFIFIFLVT